MEKSLIHPTLTHLRASRARSRGSLGGGGGGGRALSRDSMDASLARSRGSRGGGRLDNWKRPPSSPGGVSFTGLLDQRRPQTVGGDVSELNSRPLSRARTTAAGQKRTARKGQGTLPPSKFGWASSEEINGPEVGWRNGKFCAKGEMSLIATERETEREGGGGGGGGGGGERGGEGEREKKNRDQGTHRERSTI